VRAARRAAGLPRRTVALAGRHRLFTALLVIGAVVRALASWAYRPALFFFGDSYSYLSNAIGLHPNQVRPIGYPLLLHLSLLTGNLMAAPAVQHVLGLATGVIVYALLRRLGAGPVVASLAAAPVLLDAYLIDVEQHLLAEPLFIFLLTAGLALLVWRSRPSPAVCLLAGGLLSASALTRTVGMVVIAPVLLYCVLRWFGIVRTALVTAGFVLPLVLYAVWFHSTWNTYSVTEHDGYFLYGRVSTFANCSSWTSPPSDISLCFRGPPAQRPNPNYYVWTEWRVPGPRYYHLNAELRSFSLTAIENQPFAYAGTILGDLAHYAEPGHWTNRFDTNINTWRFPRAIPEPHRVQMQRWAARYGTQMAADRHVAGWLRSYQRFVFVQGPMLAAAFLAGLAAALVGCAAGRRLRAESLLFALVGLALPMTAAATTMFDYRYALPSIPPLCLAAGTAAIVAASRLRAWRTAREPEVAAPEPVALPEGVS
jgi:hypothetical protein